MRDAEKTTEAGRPSTGTKNGGVDLEDSEEEGEELLKPVKERKQSVAKLNMSPQEKDLIRRLNEYDGEGNGIVYEI